MSSQAEPAPAAASTSIVEAKKGLSPTNAAPGPASIVGSVAKIPSGVDSFLQHLHRCLATPAGIDTVLQLICYVSKLTASLADSFAEASVQKAASRFASLMLTIPYTSIDMPAPKGAARALRISASLKALSALLSEGRMFMRLWALVGMYVRAKTLVTKALTKSSGKDASKATRSEEGVDKMIAWVQLVSGVGLQFLENRAYLAQKKVINLPPASIAWAIKWSTRMWAVYVGSELGRLLVERSRKKHGIDAASEEHKAWRENWNSAFLRNLAWAPLTVSWSMEQGFAGEAGVGLLASIPGIIQARQLWKDTAKE
ncbi:hypothetical protein HOO65_020175 [Ceratocystis lukuohia]|uniref:Peroxin 11C n=2 Tax=Ceratocystis TaxID=5157 RepID=A0A2C5WZ87_9PEZI|nr:hypothetical protein CFIMG_008008RA00001 [Ceratocystis fimbriata CBS 114723]